MIETVYDVCLSDLSSPKEKFGQILMGRYDSEEEAIKELKMAQSVWANYPGKIVFNTTPSSFEVKSFPDRIEQRLMCSVIPVQVEVGHVPTTAMPIPLKTVACFTEEAKRRKTDIVKLMDTALMSFAYQQKADGKWGG